MAHSGGGGGYCWIIILQNHQNRFLGGGSETIYGNETTELTMWAANNYVLVETEELIYPLQSLVADIGGTLGLFLGFSVMSFWDVIEQFVKDKYKIDWL